METIFHVRPQHAALWPFGDVCGNNNATYAAGILPTPKQCCFLLVLSIQPRMVSKMGISNFNERSISPRFETRPKLLRSKRREAVQAELINTHSAYCWSSRCCVWARRVLADNTRRAHSYSYSWLFACKHTLPYSWLFACGDQALLIKSL